jgi:hypothetical protein
MSSARALFLCVSLVLFPRPAPAATPSDMVVFFEPGFPAADTAAPAREALQALLPGDSFAETAQLPARLARARLLILPYGSAFPEPAWESIHSFLARGGNLLVLGGKPFARAAFRDGSGWQLRVESGRYPRELLIDQYQTTPGSAGLDLETNPDRPVAIGPFAWTRAFSPLVHLSARDLYARDGSTGALDARLDTLAWGSRAGRRLASPIIQIDHLQTRFAGGRWIFLAAELPDLAQAPVAALAAVAARGSEDFSVRPRMPLYRPKEMVELDLHWKGAPGSKATVEVTVHPQAGGPPLVQLEARVPARRPVTFHAPAATGLFAIEARLRVGGESRAVYRSGFWMRDRDWLRSGPKLTVDEDYFQIDGRPVAVVGTTYMASDVQRLYFQHPNVLVWDRDMAALAADGLNMLRTGWWTGWDKICDPHGRPTPRTLRTIEAYLMTARRHGLPVQFTFFAFLPEVLGGQSPYLDPKALAAQRALVGAVSRELHDVPFLAWDIINEPSFSKRLWSDRPAGDAFELAAWNAWLGRRHPDRAALARAWDVPVGALPKPIPLPTDAAFDPRAAYSGHGSLAIHDFHRFAQETFAGWLGQLRDTIRATGSSQLITVGQDEGGFLGRLSPVYFGAAVDFTTNHSWWQNDALLWDSLIARQPGKPMLIQETGYQRELTLDQAARRDPRGEADLVACKIAASFIQGAGALQWLWHTNAFMTAGNEVSIGAIRADGTEKPEAAVVRDFARFAAALGPHLRAPERPPVAIVTSEAAQLSVLRDLQVQAQQAAVRALVRDNHQPAFVLAESQLAALGSPRLVVLPSAQALTEAGWRALLAHVEGGGSLLITGAVERDEHWHLAGRMAGLVDARIEPLVHREQPLRLGPAPLVASFSAKAQGLLEAVRFPDGASLKEIARGKGRIFWAALPVELAEGGEAARALYAHVLGRVGPAPPCEGTLPEGVVVYPTLFADAVLYVIISERADDVDLSLVDRATRARLALRLPAGRPALALLRRSDGAVIAKYGF